MALAETFSWLDIKIIDAGMGTRQLTPACAVLASTSPCLLHLGHIGKVLFTSTKMQTGFLYRRLRLQSTLCF